MTGGARPGPDDPRPGHDDPQPDDLGPEVRSYLLSTGWTAGPPGPAGALWHRGGPRPGVLAVPFRLPAAAPDLRSVVDRLAAYEDVPPGVLARRLRTQFVDVALLRAVHDGGGRDAVPLVTGLRLVQAAHVLVRAVATTSMRPRTHIDGHYLRAGDDLAARARLGRADEGPFAVPVWMPLPRTPAPPAPPDEGRRDRQGRRVLRVARVPDERRVTRTLARTLGAVDEVLLRPDREPGPASLTALVAAGGSREVVLALSDVLDNPWTVRLEARFDWAGAFRPPRGVARQVALDAGAVPLLHRAAARLRVPRTVPEGAVTGQIVEIRRADGAIAGEVAVDAVRGGRRVEVRVLLERARLDRAHDLMRAERAVLVEGRLARDARNRWVVGRPTRFVPLDEAHLVAGRG